MSSAIPPTVNPPATASHNGAQMAAMQKQATCCDPQPKEAPRETVWPIVHEERAALIDDLVDLDAQQWEQQSLCDEWSIHDVLAHLVDTAMTTRLGFVAGLVRTRFDFDRQNELGVRRHRQPTRPRHSNGFATWPGERRALLRTSTADSSRRSSTARTSDVPWASPVPTPETPSVEGSSCRRARPPRSAAPRSP
ncbi:MAG: maleylpyruvate isomerase family mycothiol-dependent enzyme [Nocardioidaceae bacterium]